VLALIQRSIVVYRTTEGEIHSALSTPWSVRSGANYHIWFSVLIWGNEYPGSREVGPEISWLWAVESVRNEFVSAEDSVHNSGTKASRHNMLKGTVYKHNNFGWCRCLVTSLVPTVASIVFLLDFCADLPENKATISRKTQSWIRVF
jgi:hypothetical protein